MRPLPEAQRDVLSAVPPLPEVSVPLDEAAGLVLATAVSAPHDVPPFANSAMDGYALIASDTVAAPATLDVLEDVPAGTVATRAVRPGTAIKIMTGAPLPEGADAVVRVEDTEPADDRVRILVPVDPGTALRPAAGDLAAGEVVFPAGEVLGPSHLGVLASLGVTHPRVRRRPLVAVLSTGDEIVPPETASLAPGKIRDSNRPQLRRLLAEVGADVLDLGIVVDDAAALRSNLAQAAGEADAILTSGGVSMGEYDLVKTVLEELGEIEFWQVAMQPAKPFAFGLLDGVPLFGLPGNPVSSMVAFEQFARPALLTMMGHEAVFRPRVAGVMGEPMGTDPAKTVFVRVRTRTVGGRWVARLAGSQSSNVLSALARADAFAVIPVGVADVADGDTVDLEMFRWPATRTAREVIDG